MTSNRRNKLEPGNGTRALEARARCGRRSQLLPQDTGYPRDRKETQGPRYHSHYAREPNALRGVSLLRLGRVGPSPVLYCVTFTCKSKYAGTSNKAKPGKNRAPPCICKINLLLEGIHLCAAKPRNGTDVVACQSGLYNVLEVNSKIEYMRAPI